MFLATVADGNFAVLLFENNMADEEAQESRLAMIAKHAKENDIDFMELIREFPTICNKKGKDFHDKRQKENCWKKISELLNTTTQEVERRYKTIRTSFTRYLAKRRGKSASGLSDIGSIDPQY